MNKLISKFYWEDIANTPDKPGVYAWYYSPELTSCDLDTAIRELKSLDLSCQRERAEKTVCDLLENRLFRYFREEPYEARIEGQLKPAYTGELHHKVSISSSLVSRIAEDPERLHQIREILEISAPWFASPLYMGMSDHLRRRLGKHKSLIERYREDRTRGISTEHREREDAGFARQIANRRIPPERLFVITCIVETSENTHIDIENILNRIYYPILGRN